MSDRQRKQPATLGGLLCSRLRFATILVILIVPLGCAFSEQSMPMQEGDLVKIRTAGHTGSTRDWLKRVHPQLQGLLPPAKHSALLTEDLTAEDGGPTDVASHFDLKNRKLWTLLDNWKGLRDSVRSIGGNTNGGTVPSWPGFDDVWIPVEPGVQLAGRLGFAVHDGRVEPADCLVLLPGLFGDNAGLRTKDLATALRNHGMHVLALELRGHGQTNQRFPDTYFNFGVVESGDLLRVSQWLKTLPQVKRTGLVAFCWGANISILSNWYANTERPNADIAAALDRRLAPPPTEKHFTAGILAFSPVLHVATLIAELEKRHHKIGNPVLASMQNTIRARIRQKHHAPAGFGLDNLIACEFAKAKLDYPGGVTDGKRYLFLSDVDGAHGTSKFEDINTPTLVVYGANDPLRPAQAVADAMARVDNPNVAAIILPGGGHVGFPAYARSYYFSLILNFFDPVNGAAANKYTRTTHATTPTANTGS